MFSVYSGIGGKANEKGGATGILHNHDRFRNGLWGVWDDSMLRYATTLGRFTLRPPQMGST